MIKKFNLEKIEKINKVNWFLKAIYKKPIIKCNTAIANYKEIIIVDFSLIGDMVMSIPFIKQIKDNCPNASITMVMRSQSVPVLKSQNLIDDFVAFDGKNLLGTPFSILANWSRIKKVLKKINEKKYDIAIEPKGDLRHTWFMHYINADRTVSYNYTGGEYLITDSFDPKEETKHLIDEKLDLLELIGFKVNRKDTAPVFDLKKKNVQGENLIIGVHPGASCKNKIYRHFDKIIDYLAGMNRHIEVKVFNDPTGDGNITLGIVESLERNHISYQVITEEIDKYIEVVAECNLMICNDSSAGHIAAAYGIPAIVIFGAIMPETSCPRGSEVLCISHECDCKPCTLDDCPNGTYECLEKIDTAEINIALEKMVGSL